MRLAFLSFSILSIFLSPPLLGAEATTCRIVGRESSAFGLDELRDIHLELVPGQPPVLRSRANLPLRGRVYIDSTTGVRTYRFPSLYIRANRRTQPFICGNALDPADHVRMFFYLTPGETPADTRDSLTFIIDPHRPELNSVHIVREERQRGSVLGVRAPACFSRWSVLDTFDVGAECTVTGLQ